MDKYRMALVPRTKIITMESGFFFVEDAWLRTINKDVLSQIEIEVQILVDQNPDYVFSVTRSLVKNGNTISWRYRVDNPNA